MSIITKNPVILLVEDELPIQSVIKKKLEINNFKVLTARTVQESIQQLEGANKVDVIWLDHYLLGGENGVDFVNKIKNNEQWRSIPIFVVSNTASGDKIDTYLELGVDHYYTKANFKLDEIIKEINEHI